MKSYPSIPHVKGYHGLPCCAFYKYDGSNLRFSWSRKRGWYKFGTRTQLFDHTHDVFGPAVKLFEETYAEKLPSIFTSNKLFRNAQEVIVFCEFVGPNSFAGQHVLEDPKELVLFDVNIHKYGLLSPIEFVETFAPHVKTADLIYQGPLTREFEQQVRENIIPGLNEGVICKGGKSPHKVWMCKIKTNAYKERLKQRFLDSWDKYWE